ncbi:MAG: hypothetical protein IH597_03595 [Bacteroidales bacterium]|nr:hypothetical protein [Bacteroidales bacterium]
MKTILFKTLAGLLAVLALFLYFTTYSSKSSIMQPTIYKEFWQKADSLKDAGIPGAAMTVVEQIHQQARLENNPPELVKAILYKISLSSEFEEDHLEKSLAMVDEAIALADMPAFSVLHSIQAELYFRYFTTNRYLILDRTTIDQAPGNDLKTWDAEAIITKAAWHYLQSVKDTDELKKTTADYFSSIIEEKEESKIYRPTLFDLLGHRALDFFMNPQASIIQPRDPLSLNQESYFARANSFSNEVLPEPSSLSFNYHSLEILRQLIGFHLQVDRTLALVDLDLKRLAWLRNNATLETKDQLYYQALEHLEKEYASTATFPEITYAIATELVRMGNTYDPFNNPEPRLKIKEAIEKLEIAIKNNPGLPSAKNCSNLLTQITQPNLQVQMEYVNLPDKPFKALVSHKNVKKIYLRVISLEPEADRELRNTNKEEKDLIKAYLNLEPYTSWHQELPDDGDMQTHNTEIPFPALPKGYYILIAGLDSAFSSEPQTLAHTSFWNSAISFVTRNNADGSIKFLVLDRENGKPLQNISATTYQRQYNSNTRSHDFIKGKSFTTSSDGTFTIQAPEKRAPHSSYALDFHSAKDRLFTENFFSQQRYDHDNRMRTQTFFFTDRALYRPGQLVYFKGIVIDTNGETHELKTNYRITVTLYDANYRKVSELALVSNEHGSFSGNFALPSDLLTGSLQLSNENGNISFSVEEYKLPRFEVKFDTLKESYKLGETLSIHGQAIAYAGNPISNAQVRFRVTRQARFPFRDYRYRSIFPSGPPTEILNGEIQTDAEGKFTVTFIAAPDLTISSAHKPVFIFNVMADVTDIQGETQSGSTMIGVGYISLILSSNINELIDRNEFDGFTAKATNLNGIEQEVSGEMKVSRLKQPSRLMRERNHSRPDRFVMDKATHDKLFPLDVYNYENDPESWEIESMVFLSEFNTGLKDKLMPPSFGSWEPGTYVIELKSKDAFGETVEFKRHFTIFKPSDRKLPGQHIWWSHVLTPTLEPGQKAKVLIGSSIRLTVLYELEVNGEIVSSQRLRLNRRTRMLEIPVTEAHLGGFRVLLTSTAHNRAFTEAIDIIVPDKRKELKIELETKRNKLEPGGREEWKILISDHKGKPVIAEMLAGMYDVSLDALKPHNWNFNLYQHYKRRFNWEANSAFSQTTANAAFLRTYPDFYNREYDKLNWFGFEMYGSPFMDYRSGGMRYANATMMMDQSLPEAKGLLVDAEADMEEMAVADSEPATLSAPVNMVRRDFRETAFFYPQLLSDEKGAVSLSFTVPESLTRWRLMGLAHTTDLSQGYFEEFFESSREVMVVPNPPRFFRQGDQMEFKTKVVNTTDKELDALVKLELFDAVTMEPVNNEYELDAELQKLVIPAKGSKDFAWSISVPLDGPYAVIYRVTAMAGSHSDGEENMLAVLTNQQLLTETMPMFVGAGSNTTFTLDKLLQSGKPGSTAMHHQLTLEFTSNPVWYAVQALPYLSEPNYRSAEALFNQYYANQMAMHIINNNPEIERVFEVWRKTDPNALLSNLEKNQDLKSIVIEETPWLNDALGESERKRQISALFERNHIESELQKSLKALLEMQLSNGGWPWMPGMHDSRHITQQIVAGFGRLQAIVTLKIEENPELLKRLQQAVQYLDERMEEEYRKIKNPEDPKLNALNAGVIQYLWARSYWAGNFAMTPKFQEGFSFWKAQAEKHWTGQNLYLQGMIALALHRIGEGTVQQGIMRSIEDRSLVSNEMGKYWRDLRQGYYWYQAPIETQALLVEAYAIINKDMASVEKMQQWLITQKRTQAWKSNRATAEAIYAILMRGTQTLATNRDLSIKIGNLTINPSNDPAIREEAGSGYFRISWYRDEISPDMAKITVNNAGNTIAWGGLYWQYFEQLDRITPHETPLKLSRSIMREVLTPSGPMLETVTTEKPLKVGDKMIMRIELRVDRDLEYVHMKDLRAPAFEPIEQISGYKYQGGLGYYESPRDVATHFFFQYLPKGTWVFEYPVVVSQTGDFSSGITTIQCLYAPEFTAHSEGIRIMID